MFKPNLGFRNSFFSFCNSKILNKKISFLPSSQFAAVHCFSVINQHMPNFEYLSCFYFRETVLLRLLSRSQVTELVLWGLLNYPLGLLEI